MRPGRAAGQVAVGGWCGVRGLLCLVSAVVLMGFGIRSTNSSSFDPQCSTRDLDEFCRWLRAPRPSRFEWPNHSKLTAVDGQGYGLVATRTIGKGQLLFSVPSSMMLTRKRAVEVFLEVLNDDSLSRKLVQSSPSDAVKIALALALCLEVDDPDSHFAPYVAALSTALKRGRFSL